MPLTASGAATSAPAGTDLKLNSVLVATDFAPTSDKAIRYAAAIARRYGSKFYLMHVVSSLGFTMAGPDALASATDLAWRDACKAEAELVHNGSLRGLEHEVIVRTGDVWQELETVVRQRDIEMLVVGTHSRRGLERLVLGSVAEQIFRHSSCPVLTVGPNVSVQAERMISDTSRPLLFATDFSEESLIALPYAVSYANRRMTRLVLLHMLSPVPHLEGDRWYTPDDLVHMRKETENFTRHQLLDLILNTKLAVEPIPIARFGSPEVGIIQTARDINALGIVLGLKARGNAISHLPWSTAYAIVCDAECPVLTVRG